MYPDSDFILNKARHFCAYQERCIKDVSDKLNRWKVRPAMAEKVIEQLIKEGYLDEERYARFFAGGKFRINHWGKNKIMHELARRGIPELIIQIGLEEIEEKEYKEALHDLLIRKNREIKEKDPLKRKKKLYSFGLQKGYDYPLVRKMLERLNI